MIGATLELLRPKHWVKNLFVFIPILVSGNLLEYQKFKGAVAAFVFFSMAASLVYVINDIKDLENDRLHPTKSKRPLPSGRVNRNSAYLVVLILSIGVAPFLYLIIPEASIVIWSYLVLNLLYTFKLKEIPIIDVSVISVGFVLRALAGVKTSDLEFSNWLIIMTFTLAMLLALGKRRGELSVNKNSVKSRKSLKNYTKDFIEKLQIIFATITLTVYIMYTFFNDLFPGNNDYLIYSSLFVMIGLARYVQINIGDEIIEEPTDVLYKDKFILLTVISWATYLGLIIYVL